MERSQFTIKIWGGRGSIPTPGSANSGYGGNTACVEMRCGERVLVFDCGSGARELGFDLCRRKVTDFDLLFGHFHYDHIMGLPYFTPLHESGTNIRMWSGHTFGTMSTFDAITDFMRLPFFPVGPYIFTANVEYRDFDAGAQLEFGDDIRIQTAHLMHPGGCTGYRVEFDDRAVVYISDHEHIPGSPNQNVLQLIDNADLVIYDSTYTDDELPEFTGYGHSTWQEGVRLCKKAGAKRMVMFHHRPRRNDEAIRKLEDEAQIAFPGAIASRDGMEFAI